MNIQKKCESILLGAIGVFDINPTHAKAKEFMELVAEQLRAAEPANEAKSGGAQVDDQDKPENDRPSGAWECQECAWLVSGKFTNCPNCDEPRPS